MSDRPSRWSRPARLSSAAPRPAVRVRMLSTGRWRPPLGPTPLVGRKAARLIAVGSALPGAGKSVVASNLAVAIAGLGRQVALADLDLGSPRQHALFGVSPAAEAERPTGIRNVRLWPAAAAFARNPDRRAVIEGLAALDADVVVVDVGHPRRDDLWDFFSLGAERLLVTTGDRSALEATYAFLQQAVARAEERHGDGAAAALATFCGGLVGNGGSSHEDAEAFHAFARLVRAELGLPLTALGCVSQSPRIVQAIAAGKPLCARRGIDDDVRFFHQMAEQILSAADETTPSCPLDGPAPTFEVRPLPADLGRYRRRHPRVAVDWAATLEIAGEPNAVRVCDVSESGAGIETTLPLRVGDQGMLHFYQLDDHLSAEVAVRNVVPQLNRIGLGFVDAGEVADRVMQAARARLAAS